MVFVLFLVVCENVGSPGEQSSALLSSLALFDLCNSPILALANPD